VQKREYDDAHAGFGTMKTTYREENLRPIDEAQAWLLYDGQEEHVPGIRPVLTPGHTRGHQAIRVEGSDRTAVFPGDVMPTAAHVGAPYSMAYDLSPLDNRESKNKLLKRAADEGWLIFIDHEVATPVMKAQVEKDWYELAPAEE
jgi:glyoxylase-like metal-dependent hydrolase (beta-lactamase superfamily II)